MLRVRVVSALCTEGQALEMLALSRRDGFRRLRAGLASVVARAASTSQHPRKLKKYRTTVLSSEPPGGGASAPPPSPRAQPQQQAPPPQPPPRRAWTLAAALALTASLGGAYVYRKMSDETRRMVFTPEPGTEAPAAPTEEEPPSPALGSAFPARVEYLVVGGGTAAFAALRALRAAAPGARVLLVSEERALPYMRPPLSKELWREPDLAARAADPDRLTFRQWNGKRRSVTYEPAAFYTPVERLGEAAGGAAVARGWRVARLDVARRTAELQAPGRDPVTVSYDRCLLATGVRPRRLEALRAARAGGRALALRGVRDVARLAHALDDPATRTVAVVGGSFLATELSAALADRLSGSGRRVVQLVSEQAPLAGVLPLYLAKDAQQRLSDAGVTLVTGVEVKASEMVDGRVRMELARSEASEGAKGEGAGALEAELVVECVGSEAESPLALAAGLEQHPELGGVVVNGELQAASGVWAAGDAACFYDAALGRRRLEHHDHAVVSGRLAAENMAGREPPHRYDHQSMFWSDLGPQLGYEAIGLVDARLPTVGVFAADAVRDHERAWVGAPAAAPAAPDAAPGAPAAPEPARRYERGVVFYLRGSRVVGVLLWNLFNRMHVARQVLAQGEFEDLFEVAKLFAPHEED